MKLINILISITLLASCAGIQSVPVLEGNGNRHPSGFSLSVLDGTYIEDGQGTFSTNTYSVNGQTVVEVTVENAKNLHAIYLQMNFDPGKHTPVSAVSAEWLPQAGEFLRFSGVLPGGRWEFGEVLMHPELADGLSGSGLVASFNFVDSKSPARDAAQSVSVHNLQIHLATLSEITSQLVGGPDAMTFMVSGSGDYNQDGITDVQDLTPLALHYGHSGNFDPLSVQYLVDSDSSREINLDDLKAIRENHGFGISEFHIFRNASPGATYPSAIDESPRLDPIAVIPYGNSEGNPDSSRLYWMFHPKAKTQRDAFWIRAYNDGKYSALSNIVSSSDHAWMLEDNS